MADDNIQVIGSKRRIFDMEETPVLLDETKQELPSSFSSVSSAPRDDNDSKILSFVVSLYSLNEDPLQLIRDIANPSMEVKSSFILPECDQRLSGSEPFACDGNAKEFSRKFEDLVVQFQENKENREMWGYCGQENDLLCHLVSGSFVRNMNSQNFSTKAENWDILLQDNKISVSFDEDNRGKIEETVKDLKCEAGFPKVQEFERNLKEPKVDKSSVMVGKNETLMEAKKKKIPAKVDAASIFNDKYHLRNSLDCDTSIGILVGLKGIDKSVRSSLKMQVIDDTLLVGTVPLVKTDNGGAKIVERSVKKIVKKEEAEVKKAKWPRKNAKNVNNGEAMKDKQQKMSNDLKSKIQTDEYGLKNGDEIRKYSREEMVELRFMNVFQQRKLWRVIYTGLEDSVVKEYDELARSNHHHRLKKKNFHMNFDHRYRFGKQENVSGILGMFDPRGRWNHMNMILQ